MICLNMYKIFLEGHTRNSMGSVIDYKIWPQIPPSPCMHSLLLCGFAAPTIKRWSLGNSLGVQWLGLCTFTSTGGGSIPGQGTKILRAAWCGEKEKEEMESVSPHSHSCLAR